MKSVDLTCPYLHFLLLSFKKYIRKIQQKSCSPQSATADMLVNNMKINMTIKIFVKKTVISNNIEIATRHLAVNKGEHGFRENSLRDGVL